MPLCWVPECSGLRRRVCPTFLANSLFSDSGTIRDRSSFPSSSFPEASVRWNSGTALDAVGSRPRNRIDWLPRNAVSSPDWNDAAGMSRLPRVAARFAGGLPGARDGPLLLHPSRDLCPQDRMRRGARRTLAMSGQPGHVLPSDRLPCIRASGLPRRPGRQRRRDAVHACLWVLINLMTDWFPACATARVTRRSFRSCAHCLRSGGCTLRRRSASPCRNGRCRGEREIPFLLYQHSMGSDPPAVSGQRAALLRDLCRPAACESPEC